MRPAPGPMPLPRMPGMGLLLFSFSLMTLYMPLNRHLEFPTQPGSL